MSDEHEHVDVAVRAHVEDDGAIYLAADDIIHVLHHVSAAFGEGVYGGNRSSRKAAAEALLKTADGIQDAYVDALSDEVLARWDQ